MAAWSHSFNVSVRSDMDVRILVSEPRDGRHGLRVCSSELVARLFHFPVSLHTERKGKMLSQPFGVLVGTTNRFRLR